MRKLFQFLILMAGLSTFALNCGDNQAPTPPEQKPFWQQTGLTDATVFSLAVNSDGVIFAGTDKQGVFRSTDHGESWMAVSNGLPRRNGTYRTIRDLVINSTGHIFVATAEGVFRSMDNGESWEKTGEMTGFWNIDVLLSNSHDHLFAIAGSGDIFRSTDNGDTWSLVLNSQELRTSFISLAVNALDHIFAGTDDGEVWRSTDNGDTWTSISQVVEPYLYIFELAVDSSDRLFASAFPRDISVSKVFRSPDSGATWIDITEGITHAVWSFAFNSMGHLFAGTIEGGVFQSVDHGNNWKQINSGLTSLSVLNLVVDVGDYLFAATVEDGVFRSINPTISVED